VPPRKGAAGSGGAAAGEEDELYPGERKVTTPRGGGRDFTVVLPCPVAMGARRDDEERQWMGGSTSAWNMLMAAANLSPLLSAGASAHAGAWTDSAGGGAHADGKQ
jgi:hypothetical protein